MLGGHGNHNKELVRMHTYIYIHTHKFARLLKWDLITIILAERGKLAWLENKSLYIKWNETLKDQRTNAMEDKMKSKQQK